jgi:hypothetical protein
MRLEIPFLSGKNGHSEGRAGDEGQLIYDMLHGKYYHATEQGRVFSQTNTPLGLALPVYTATALAGTMPIWNPMGSGVKVVPISVSMHRASGTAAVTSFGLYGRNGVGSVIATGSQITAFADTEPINGRLGRINSIGGQGGGQSSKVKSSNAGTVTVTAGVAAEELRALGGTGVEADTTANGISRIHYEFEGTVQAYPGTLIWIAARLASVALYNITILWEEVVVDE